jgi:membrane associated rhomboid family serine protease
MATVKLKMWEVIEERSRGKGEGEEESNGPLYMKRKFADLLLHSIELKVTVAGVSLSSSFPFSPLHLTPFSMLKTTRRRRLILYILLVAVPVSFSLPLPSWRIGTAKLIDQRQRRCASSKRGRVLSIDCRSYGLPDEDDDDCHEWDCESDDDSVLLDSDSINPIVTSQSSALKARGGNVNAPTKYSPLANIGLTKTKNKRSNARSQLQALQSLQRQKLIQFHKNFRRKQIQFQNSLYALNARSNPYFPRPPYNLWRIDPGPGIGKTSLTGKLFIINIVAFGLQTAYPALTAWGAKRSDLILSGRQLHRLITPVFLHGGIGHLMSNSYSLKNMGLNVERAFGPSRFLAVYFVSGVVGNIFSAVKSPNPAVGASGAIFGLVGAYYTFLNRNEHLFGYSAQMQQSALLETIGINVLLGLTNPMIDNWGHAGGFVGGAVMSYLFGPKLYMARVPAGDDSLDAGGFGLGKVVVDRPTVAIRVPQVIEDQYIVLRENIRCFGMRLSGAASGFVGGDTVYKLVDGKGSAAELPGNVSVTPVDGFRQDVTELNSTINRRVAKRHKRSMPRPGRSLRPRFGHLYR